MSVEFGDVVVDAERGTAKIRVDKNIYSKAAVLEACYWLGRDLNCHIEEGDRGDSYALFVGLRAAKPTLEEPRVRSISEWLPDVFQHLVDAQLRVEIEQQTAPIRELILAKAFAESGVLEDAPPGTFEDPVAKPRRATPLVNITKG